MHVGTCRVYFVTVPGADVSIEYVYTYITMRSFVQAAAVEGFDRVECQPA